MIQEYPVAVHITDDALIGGTLMFMRNNTARDWILRYIEMRHDLNDPNEVLRLAQTADYLDQNTNVTETGQLLFEFGMFSGVYTKSHEAA